MRASILLSALAAITAVAAHPAAAPAVSEDKIPIGVIQLKDVDPSAPNGDLVIGRVWSLPNTTLPENRLHKRYFRTCYNGAHWVSQDNLYSAKNGVCNWLQSNNPVSYGWGATVEWEHYQDASGNWIHLVDQNWAQVRTSWDIWASPSEAWSWDRCFNTLFQMIWVCPGSNPDTAGGLLNDYYGWDTVLRINGL
ncbi:hypothetical protein ABW20_dc0108068 [Dactylellina cionopaga]|nr:hypothetical protein ABW20_dc0108068 [Dactylellina cionopaga]